MCQNRLDLVSIACFAARGGDGNLDMNFIFQRGGCPELVLRLITPGVINMRPSVLFSKMFAHVPWAIFQTCQRMVQGCSNSFSHFSVKFESYIRNEAHKQYSPLDTIFHYIFDFVPPGKYL